MSSSKNTIDQATSPELASYYANRPLMWRNMIFMSICNLGWQNSMQIVWPLMALELLSQGVRENVQATIGAINGWALMFLVMWFSWMSDHTVSKIGRRKPYLFLSAPVIIGVMAVFPFVAQQGWLWLLMLLYVLQIIFMDLKASTFPLLSIDCVPRPLLARMSSLFNIAGALTGFLAMRYAGDLIKVAEWFPYVLGAGVMTLTTASAWWIKEPPIYNPKTERFKLWSTFKVTARDKRIFWLMAGVAMINAYITMSNMWIWFWAKEALGLDRGEIFHALSWAGLVNIVLAYPIGWAIDRWGGFRVIVLYWLGQVACFAWMMTVHDKMGLIILSVATTTIWPLYNAAEIMVFKTAHPKDVGSITSTLSCFRNGYNAALGLVAGWVIFFFGHDFRIGFVIGIAMSTVGLLLFIVYQRKMRAPLENLLESQAASAKSPLQSALTPSA